MKVTKFIRSIASVIYRSIITMDSDTYIRYLRGKGVQIGENVKFYNPSSNTVDLTRPYLITIGNKVKITGGVVILTHGFDWCVLRECYKRPFGSAGRVSIGNNVFLGMNTIILKGVSLGDNVIVGAGSVVTSNIPSNSVAAGNPAKVICTLAEYYEKRCAQELSEASEKAKALFDRHGCLPEPEDFKEFFYFFVPRDSSAWKNQNIKRQVGDYMEEFLSTSPLFSSFEDFLQHCLEVERYSETDGKGIDKVDDYHPKEV